MDMSESHQPQTSPIPPRHIFANLPAYVAGKPAPQVAGLTQYKLSSNENPLGPVPKIAEILSTFDAVHRYPDPLSTKLREALAKRFNLDAENIVTGAGSLGALNQILKAFAGVDADGVQDEVIYAWRSFEAYPILVGLLGAKSVQIPNLPNGAHDLQGMLDAITDRTRVILVCTPNNPTGPAVTKKQIREFLAQVPPHIVVVLDEAYFEFCTVSPVPDGEDAPLDGLRLYREYPNVIVLRTFSKAQGLAGLRVGYSVSHPQLTQYLRVSATTFAVTAVAEAAAVASIEHEDQVMERVQHLVAERERVVARLHELGYNIPQTYANFVWLPLGEHTAEFTELARANALAVRAFDSEGVRVSIGEDEANDRFISICEQFPHRV